MKEVFIGIGSNLGNRRKNIMTAIDLIRAVKEIKIKKISSFLPTKPYKAPGPNYLNAAIEIETNLNPEALLEKLNQIEAKLGRKRTFKNCPRTIDLDILLYGKEIIRTARLKIPHPDMANREFVKKPLLEIRPSLISFLNDYYKKN